MTAPENKYVKASGKSTTRLAVGGLCGGHSGIDIHRHRASALKLLACILGDMPAGDDIHSPSELLHVPSLSRLWDFLVALLQSLSQDR